MLRPACIKCGRFMEKTAIGVNVAEMAKSTAPRPYKIWHADVHTCPGCGYNVIAHYADEPHWQHFHDDPIPFVTHAIWER